MAHDNKKQNSPYNTKKDDRDIAEQGCDSKRSKAQKQDSKKRESQQHGSCCGSKNKTTA